MGGFFDMPKGEFVGTALLLALALAIAAFNLFFIRTPKPQADLTPYAEMIAAFDQRQAAYADSVSMVRALRDSAYAARYRGCPNRYPHYRDRVFYRDSSLYQKDTARMLPLPKRREYAVVKVDLNTCDTADIIRVPQFGSKRAQKIVEYRDRLGGFHSLEQLHEIYILQNVDLDYCADFFSVNPSSVKKIKVNSMSYKELKSHPYFDAYLAKTIVNYREKNGKIRNVVEFQQITHAYQELMDKLSPYLSFE